LFFIFFLTLRAYPQNKENTWYKEQINKEKYFVV
jgi:hypothetical protein